MEIRSADINDLDAIVSLEAKQFPKDPWNRTQWEYEFTSNDFSFVKVLVDEGKIIGYVDYWILFEQATINKVCIAKEYENKGLGNMLFKECLKHIDETYCVSTSLEVRVSNTPAIKLYEKNLFKHVLIKEQYYSDGEDCYFMIRSIGDIYE